jgi:hypothetical protein
VWECWPIAGVAELVMKNEIDAGKENQHCRLSDAYFDTNYFEVYSRTLTAATIGQFLRPY